MDDIGAGCAGRSMNCAETDGLFCDVCGNTFLSKQSLSHHMMRHLGTLPYSCHLCNYQGVRIGRLKQHITKHHGEHELKNALTTPSVKPNTMSHKIRSSQLLSCPTCNKTSTSKQALKNHMKQHSGEKTFSCPHCNFATIQKVHLDSHILRRHAARHELDGKIACTKCPRILSNPESLKYHMLVHENSKPYPCDFCSEAFRTQKFLTRHQTLKHPGKQYGARSVSTPSNYYTPIQCSICTKTLSNQYSYKNHMSRHARSLQCHKCNETFSQKRSYTIHLKKHGQDTDAVQEEPILGI